MMVKIGGALWSASALIKNHMIDFLRSSGVFSAAWSLRIDIILPA
jgi:hypothetical protein